MSRGLQSGTLHQSSIVRFA